MVNFSTLFSDGTMFFAPFDWKVQVEIQSRKNRLERTNSRWWVHSNSFGMFTPILWGNTVIQFDSYMFQIVLVKNHQLEFLLNLKRRPWHAGKEIPGETPWPPGRYHYHVASCEGLYRGGESSGPGGDWLDIWWVQWVHTPNGSSEIPKVPDILRTWWPSARSSFGQSFT